MPFPFLPAGILLAATVLIAAFAAFGLALKALNRAALAARESITPGIVAGIRTWAHPELARHAVSSPSGPEPMITPAVPTERVHRR